MSALPLGALRRISAQEWPEVLIAVAVAAVVEIGLRTMPLPRLARALGTPLRPGAAPLVSPPVTSNPMLPPRARAQVQATRRVMRHWPFGDTCLRQALVAGQRLRRLDPTLQVGVTKTDGQVRAHAWLEIDGVILDPMRAAGSYAPMVPVDHDRNA